jgi:hypothetical protein
MDLEHRKRIPTKVRRIIQTDDSPVSDCKKPLSREAGWLGAEAGGTLPSNKKGKQIIHDQLQWVYETDSSDDSILFARPVFPRREHNTVTKTVKKGNNEITQIAAAKRIRKLPKKKDLEKTPIQFQCCHCASCVCKRKTTLAIGIGENSEEAKELEIIEELKTAVLNSERHNSIMERLERKLRAVRVRMWRTRLGINSLSSQNESDSDQGLITYDDVNIGVIKRRDIQNVDGFNQKTLTQMYAQGEEGGCGTEPPTIGNVQHHREELSVSNQREETFCCMEETSVGTLFGDNLEDDTTCVRYDNGTGPLWLAYRWSPYVNRGLEDLCQLITDFDGTKEK